MGKNNGKEWYVGIFHKLLPIKIFFKICGYKDSRFEAEVVFIYPLRLPQLSHWNCILVISISS